MTTEEFSNEFDILVSSYRRFKQFDRKEELDSLEFDEFEKSVYLTDAQESIVIDLYSGTLLEGFESTEQVRRYLNSIVKYKEINLENENTANYLTRAGLKYYSIDLSKQIDNLLFITYESVSFKDDSLGCKNGTTVQVIPTRQDELSRVVKNPFRGPNTSRALRVDAGSNTIELVSKYSLGTYYIGYLEKPTPIILAPLPDDLSIDGKSTVMNSSLDPVLHRDILKRAVQTAVNSKISFKEKEK